MVHRCGTVLLAVALSFVVAGPGAARPLDATRLDATPVALSGPAAKFWGYITPLLVVEKGGELTYTNLDVEKHDLVHDADSDGFGGPKKMPWCKRQPADGHHHHHGSACPVFWSDQIGLGQSTQVLGLKNLKPGTLYTFFCTLHHGMRGTLIAR